MEHNFKKCVSYLQGCWSFKWFYLYLVPWWSIHWEHKLHKINYDQCLCTLWQNHCELYIKEPGLFWAQKREEQRFLLNTIHQSTILLQPSSSNLIYPWYYFHLINERASLKFQSLCCRILDIKLNCSMWELVKLHFQCFEDM